MCSILHEDYKDWTTYWPSHFSNNYLRKKVFKKSYKNYKEKSNSDGLEPPTI